MGTMTRVMERLQDELEARDAELALTATDDVSSDAPEASAPAAAPNRAASSPQPPAATNFVAEPTPAPQPAIAPTVAAPSAEVPKNSTAAAELPASVDTATTLNDASGGVASVEPAAPQPVAAAPRPAETTTTTTSTSAAEASPARGDDAFAFKAEFPDTIEATLVETPSSERSSTPTLNAEVVNEIVSPASRPANNGLLDYDPDVAAENTSAAQAVLDAPAEELASDSPAAPSAPSSTAPSPTQAASVQSVESSQAGATSNTKIETPQPNTAIDEPIVETASATIEANVHQAIDVRASDDGPFEPIRLAPQDEPPRPAVSSAAAAAATVEQAVLSTPTPAAPAAAETVPVNPFADPTNIVRLVAATIAELRKTEAAAQPEPELTAAHADETNDESGENALDSATDFEIDPADIELDSERSAEARQTGNDSASAKATTDATIVTKRDAATVTCTFSYDAPEPEVVAAFEQTPSAAIQPQPAPEAAEVAPAVATEPIANVESPARVSVVEKPVKAEVDAAPVAKMSSPVIATAPSPVVDAEPAPVFIAPPPLVQEFASTVTASSTGAARQRLQGNRSLGVCALSPAGANVAIVALRDRFGALCEQFRAAATRLLSLNPTGRPQAIAVSSSLPREGKSVFITNVALALAEGGHRRVILVDTDLRSGAVARLLGASSERGVADYLSGAAALTDVVQDTSIENFQIVSAGRTHDRSPAELLGGPRLDAMIRELRRHADYVLIDTPAVLHCADASMVGAHCDGALLIIAGGRTNEAAVSDAARTLRGNNVKLLGCILTACEDPSASRHEHRH